MVNRNIKNIINRYLFGSKNKLNKFLLLSKNLGFAYRPEIIRLVNRHFLEFYYWNSDKNDWIEN